MILRPCLLKNLLEKKDGASMPIILPAFLIKYGNIKKVIKGLLRGPSDGMLFFYLATQGLQSKMDKITM